MMNIYATMSLVSFLAIFMLGMIVFYHNPRNRLNQVFLHLSLALSGWAFVDFGLRRSYTYEEAVFWHNLDHFWIIAIPLMLHMILLFTEQYRSLTKSITYFALYIPAVLVGILDVFTSHLTGPPIMTAWGWSYQMPPMDIYSFLTVLWTIIASIISVVLLINYYLSKKDFPDIRKGTLLVLASVILSNVAGIVTESNLFYQGQNVPHITVYSFILSSALLGISVWKYKIFIIMPGSMAETVFENMADSLLLVSRDCHILQVNKAASKLLGASTKELLGRNIKSFIIDVENVREYAEHSNTIDTPSDVCEKAVSVKSCDGRIFPVTISIVPLPEKKSHKQGFLCVMRDISERCEVEEKLRKYHEQLEDLVVERTRELLKSNNSLTREVAEHRKTETELEKSKRRFQDMVDLLPEIVYEIDENGMVTFANQQTFVMTGYDQSDLDKGYFSLNLLAPEDRERAHYNIQLILEGKPTSASEYTIIRKDGSRIPVISKNAPIVSNGNIIGIRGIFVDITERKKVELALMNYERRFRETLENISLLALMVDKYGAVTFCNDHLLKVTGWSAGDLIDVNITETMVLPENREQIKELLVSGEIPSHFETEILTKSGEKRLVFWSNTVLHDPDGNIIGINSIGEDITEKRNLERQFQQAQKMESVGRLAGGIAHDFNNLLTIILGNAEIGLLALEEHKQVQDYLTEIKRTATRASDLTRQLLAFSRFQITETKVVDVNQTLLQMDKMLRRLIGEDIEMVMLPEDDLGPVRIDPGQFEQVITNLVVNSRDAMPEGGVLTIMTENRIVEAHNTNGEIEPGEYVCVNVSDTGTGISDDVISHLFEPFFTTKELGKGTGLGLATCYGIVGQNNGIITVSSEINNGTTMHVYLPKALESAEYTTVKHEEQKDVSGTESILLVEDEMGLIRTLSLMLTQNGYQVTTASNGEEALRIIKKTGVHSYDLIVTDVVMPRMGGRELVVQIIEMNSRMKILYMSGYTDSKLAIEDLEQQGCAFIQKPFTTNDFMYKIRQHLDFVEDASKSLA